MDARVLPRRRGKMCRLLHLVIALALVCPVLAAPATAAAQGPGTTNPAARFSEWPDDELFLVRPPRVTTAQRLSIFAPSSDLKEQTELDHTEHTDSNAHDAIALAAGRFLTAAHDSVLYAYRYASTMVGLSFFRPEAASPVAKLSGLSARVAGGTDFFDIAGGDVDGQPALDGEYRDEAVVAWAKTDPTGKLPISVAVLAFGQATEASPVPTATTTALASGTLDAASIAAGTIRPIDNALSLALGDFNGDGTEEIAIAYLSSPTALTVDVFQYSAALVDHTIQRSLTRVGSTTVTLSAGHTWNESLSLAAGDFDGDLAAGRDELALATSERFISGTTHRQDLRLRLFETFCTDGVNCSSSPAITIQQAPAVTDIGTTLEDNGAGIARRVQIVAGFFAADPQNMKHRQIAAAYADPIGGGRDGRLRLVQVDGALGVTLGAAITTATVNEELFWLAAGAFKGSRSSADPVWSLVWSYWTPADYGYMYFDPVGTNLAFMKSWGTADPGAYPAPTPGARAPVVAVDTDGDSMYLGAPIHMILYDVANLDFLLQEPPKHAYWDPDSAQVVSVSRTADFNITMVSSEGTSFTSKSTDSADWAIGGSIGASAKATVEGSASCIIASASSSASLEIEGKVAYDYQQHESSYGVDEQTRTVSFSGSTNTDDYLVGRLQTLHIWRYPIFGMQLDGGRSPFFEVVIPGNATDLNGEILNGEIGGLQTDAAGLNFDWYQPLHENGNILSYPELTASTFSPADLGSYTIPCTPGTTGCVDGKLTITELMLEPRVQFCDGNTGAIALTFSSESGGGAERSSSHTLAENAAIRGTYSTKVEVGVRRNKASASTELTAEAELHNSNSWGKAATSNYTTSSSTGITLNRKGCNSENAYAYYPVLYQTTDGTIKASFAADPLGSNSGDEWWTDHYGQLPDLALNLPLRFHFSTTSQWNTGNWMPTSSDARKQMRGFFVRHSQPNPVTGAYDEYPGAVRDGDTVRLEARVYNYSVSQSVAADRQVKVRFDAVPYDYGTNRETGPRVTIGTATLPALGPRQMVTASVVWDTTGMALGPSQMYRIYVVLDPENAVEEKYEAESQATQFYRTYDLTHPAGEYWTSCEGLSAEEYAAKVCTDPAQNNEGFGYITIALPPARTGTGRVSADISMDDAGVAALDAEGDLVTDSLETYIGRPVPIRVTVHSDVPSLEPRQVLVFDGDPAQGGVPIAGKKVSTSGTDENGSSVWFEWVPNTAGLHRLYAVATEASDDPVPGNNTDTLDVQVVWTPTTSYLPTISH